jgi:hypothetical protein
VVKLAVAIHSLGQFRLAPGSIPGRCIVFAGLDMLWWWSIRGKSGGGEVSFCTSEDHNHS